jgi:hypothetical protein
MLALTILHVLPITSPADSSTERMHGHQLWDALNHGPWSYIPLQQYAWVA